MGLTNACWGGCLLPLTGAGVVRSNKKVHIGRDIIKHIRLFPSSLIVSADATDHHIP